MFRQAQVVVQTPKARYACLKPAAAYRAVFGHLMEQADIAWQVCQALSPPLGGSPEATLDQVVAKLARTKVDLLLLPCLPVACPDAPAIATVSCITITWFARCSV